MKMKVDYSSHLFWLEYSIKNDNLVLRKAFQGL